MVKAPNGDGWIDEADDVFSKFKVWTYQNSVQKLLSLADADVGAIHLKNGDTEFTVKDGQIAKQILENQASF